MWVSKKKWASLEKRVTALEEKLALATLWWMPHFYIL